MKRILFCTLLASALTGQAENIRVHTLRITQPIITQAPLLTDSTDVAFQPWDNNARLMGNIKNLAAWRQGVETNDSILIAPEGKDAIRLAGFTLENRNYARINVTATGTKEHLIYIDGREGGYQDIFPGRHEVVLKIRQEAGNPDTLLVHINTEQEITLNPTTPAPYTLATLMNGERIGGVNISPDGRFLVLDKSVTSINTKVEWTKYLIDLQTGNRSLIPGFKQWTSKGHTYIISQTNADAGVGYYMVDAVTGKRQQFFTDYSYEQGDFLPGEQFMLINKQNEGPKEDPDVFQVLTPDDRQPGWRNRNNILLMDVASGQLRPLTQGQHNAYGSMSPDQKKLLLTISEQDLTRRPFNFTTALVLNLETMQTDTLFTNEGFAGNGQWSPDGKSVVFSGSPEAFGGIGKRVPEGMTPSMIEQELFLLNLTTKEVTPLTADLDPSVTSWQWSKADGMIYALCENRDNQDIFRINPKTGKHERLKLSERYVFQFDLATEKPLLTYYGQGHSNSDRLYVVDLKSGKERLVEDLHATRMKDVELGLFSDWNFQSERGDTIYGRYYLPPNFDPTKKYPMLVYYYGGCSPVGRYLDSYYSYHGWAAMGYVVYVIQPSGCTGFGQEFAARHVNAYGKYTADDIIQGTKQFCKEHPFVNTEKIGCLGASYGGFMTQYLQTQTDIFAAAMSHAGISDPSSYWGYGYWGYSYSTVSAANSYPWNNKELYTEHAPLNMADRIHTPILFMHGSSDNNVPINESIQMFTALKLLGRECAFVTVNGQDHHITDYTKRIKWQSTIYAWFQKWLKDDPLWWETMYPTKNLK